MPENAPHIAFRNVTFRYDHGSFALNNIDFTLERDEMLGIIGATGSGKSTVIRALMRYYDIAEGAIEIDGVDIRDYATVDLRRKFGVVFQNDTLFKDTIRENIQLGRRLNDGQSTEAARQALALEFIREQDGLDAKVAIKGANLSGGQKQRLLVARALAGEPEILVLDDSSSALDYRTDAALREEIKKHCANATKIIIAQRISSIMHAEKIIVMENGNMAAMGSDVFDKLTVLPVGYFDTHQTGDILSRISYDIDTISTSLSNDLVQVFASSFTVVGSLVMMLAISPLLVLVFAVTVPLSIFLTKKITGFTRPLFCRRSAKLGELNGFVEEMISGQKTLCAYEQEENTISKMEEKNSDTAEAYYKADYYGSTMGPSVNVVNNLSLSLVSFFGAVLYLKGAISIGNISTFVLYSRRFSGSINEIANII